MSGIPKIFHHIWFGSEASIPAANLVFRDHLKRLHPHWDFRLWTDKNLPPIINRQAFDIYSPTKVFASDILRYEILADQGGVYVDWDVFIHKPIDDLIEAADHFFGEESPGFVTNCIYGMAPNHWLSWKIVRECRRSHMLYTGSGNFAGDKQEALAAVGAQFFSRTVNETSATAPLNILPHEIFNPYSPRQFRGGMWNPEIPPTSYGIHTFSSVVDQRKFEFYRELPDYETHKVTDLLQRRPHDS